MLASALVILAEGAEEMETVITVDVLRRAEIKVTLAGLNGAAPVKCSRDVVLLPDAALADVAEEKYDLIVVPGGNPTSVKQLAESSLVGKMLKSQDESSLLIGAICAGPKSFIPHKIGLGKVVTSYPLFKQDMEAAGYKYSEERLCIDGNIITSRGPGTALEFALACASATLGNDFKAEHGAAMLINF